MFTPFPWRSIQLVIALTLGLIAGGTELTAKTLEQRALALEDKLMAPCCGGGTVRNHESGATVRMRQEIRRSLAAGDGEQQIIDRFVAEHGAAVLGAPPPRGFNALAYVFAPLVMLSGAAALIIVLRRWARSPAAVDVAAPAPPIDPADQDRLDRALRERG